MNVSYNTSFTSSTTLHKNILSDSMEIGMHVTAAKLIEGFVYKLPRTFIRK